MRVIAGTARSVPLEAPRGMSTRPTLDKIKETLFNILQFKLEGAIFVDIFAGSGSIGIEALSRGASMAMFIDNSSLAVKVIKKNLEKCHLETKAFIYRCDATRADIYMENCKEDAERLIVFMDPPYLSGLEKNVFKELSYGNYVTKDTLFVLEEAKTYDISEIVALGSFTVTKIKKYKNQQHIFIRMK